MFRSRAASWRLLAVATALLAGLRAAHADPADSVDPLEKQGMYVRMPGKSHQGELPELTASQRELADEMKADLRHLTVEIGERNLNKPDAYARAALWIEAELKQAGYEVRQQKFAVKGRTCLNLEAELAGGDKARQIVVVGAHYDSLAGTIGANDNGTGVVALLALARRFAREKPAGTIRFVAFANEEPPYFQTDAMGSLVYAKACEKDGDQIVAAIILETIGYYSDEAGSQQYPPLFKAFYPTTGNFIGFVGNSKSSKLVKQSVRTFREKARFPCEGAALPEFIQGVGWSDHWAFWQAGYPALMVTDTAPFRYPYYHTTEDTIDKIDFERMARVVEGMRFVVADLAE